MEKRLELEMRGREPHEILTLTLDNCRTTQIAGITDEFVKLETLSLINVGLTTLKGFPNLPALKKLELSDNRISGGLENLVGCPNLVTLNLSGNKIKDLKELKNLKTLDLYNCEVTGQNDFRTKVYEMIPHLCYLDGFDREDVEAAESDSVDDEDEDEEPEEEETEEEDEDDEEEEAGDEEVGLDYLHSEHVLKVLNAIFLFFLA
ncbi:unnamed protein product [Soboliphyme baturini]|uniref:LRRcap domain-containing protein n=1 Tax=Soboliphyme baturini TaxID=241478 RepID=A0A183ITR7_9BILA|nr:unnamed protein product [Soboliphyme baturini]